MMEAQICARLGAHEYETLLGMSPSDLIAGEGLKTVANNDQIRVKSWYSFTRGRCSECCRPKSARATKRRKLKNAQK
jgi:hypothetical protein